MVEDKVLESSEMASNLNLIEHFQLKVTLQIRETLSGPVFPVERYNKLIDAYRKRLISVFFFHD